MPKIINPYNEEVLYTYDYISRKKLDTKIEKAKKTFEIWKNTSFQERAEKFKKLSNLMLERKEELAKIDTDEMWMLFSGALWDVSKTALWINYVSDKASEWLSDIKFNEWWITWKRVFNPIWVLYSISPYNFPYNQVFRNATPNIMAWNVVLSKHSSNVAWVAKVIEELFLEAGFPEWVYQNINISSSESEYLISHRAIKWVNITGWDKAWRSIWNLAGKYLKPSILELGWVDPFILLDTYDLDATVKLAQSARLSSCGQKCNSSKKFIVIEKYYDEFCEKLKNNFSSLTLWNPNSDNTDIWPLATKKSVDELVEIVEKAISDWAKVLTWWKAWWKKGYFFEPTVICWVTTDMQLFDTETFWPIASIIKVKSVEEAIKIANLSNYWLTSSVITSDKDLFIEVSSKLETWSVFHNKIPTSYPFLPYWWVKDSWYWKELSEVWIKNFVNEKVIVY